MTPAATHLHGEAPQALATYVRRATKRPTRHPALDLRTKARLRHARITLADSPELYMREEMG